MDTESINALPPARSARQAVAVVAAILSGSASAASWTIAPQVALSEIYSTNMALSPLTASHGWISDIAPGLLIEGQGSRVKASLDYRLDILRYAGQPALNRNLNSLASKANVEAIEKWLFLDASANIVQRRTSAFDPVTLGPIAPANQAETTTIQFSPYVQGQVSDLAAYRLRFSAITARSDDTTFVKTNVTQWAGTLKNASAATAVGWFIDGNTSKVRNDVIGSREDIRLRGGLTFEPLSTVRLSLSDGREHTNFLDNNSQTTSTPGIGIQWSPGPRTQFAAQNEKRFFGTAHSLLINHRTALTNWRYTDVKDVEILPTLLSASGQGAITELMSDLLASSIPDPVARSEAVRNRLDQFGQLPNQAAPDAVQTSRLFINHAREASVALIGRRDTVTFNLTERTQQSLSTGVVVNDSFALSNDIRERGASLSWLHRLTPLTTLNVSTARLRTEGLNASNLQANQFIHTISMSFRMSPKAVISIGARQNRFDSSLNGSFRENALACTLIQRF